MRSLVLSILLLCPTSFMGVEYPNLVNCYLDGMQMEDKDQHDRIERALLHLDGMDREDLVLVMGYLCMILQVPDVETDCGCDCCCDVVELIEQECANNGINL